MPPSRIAEERLAFAEAGVQHVVSAPWRHDIDSWIEAMEALADIVLP
jgi:hypothetical protein